MTGWSGREEGGGITRRGSGGDAGSGNDVDDNGTGGEDRSELIRKKGGKKIRLEATVMKMMINDNT